MPSYSEKRDICPGVPQTDRHTLTDRALSQLLRSWSGALVTQFGEGKYNFCGEEGKWGKYNGEGKIVATEKGGNRRL